MSGDIVTVRVSDISTIEKYMRERFSTENTYISIFSMLYQNHRFNEFLACPFIKTIYQSKPAVNKREPYNGKGGRNILVVWELNEPREQRAVPEMCVAG